MNSDLPDDIQSCGILGPDIVLPLRKNRNCELEFEYTVETTLGEVKQKILERLQSESPPVRIALYNGNERCWIVDDKAYFDTVLKKYWNPECSNKIRVGAYVSSDAGTVHQEGKLRFYMNSHESGRHNRPHVHVRTASYDYEASIDIQTGEVLAGNLPKKELKNAKKVILSDSKYFIECWNEMTDGLSIDINNHYGLTDY